MSGMINQNTLLKQAQAKIESKIAPGVRENYEKIVVSGMKLALDKGPKGIMASVAKSQDPVGDIVKGAVHIVLIMRKGARGTMPPDAMVPAMFTLMLHALDYAERAGVLKVDATVLDEATQDFASHSLKSMGVSDDKLKGMTDQVQGMMNDPEQVKKLQQHANSQGA